ncbi:MAG: hypothetical protein KIG65_03580 [Eubacteriales bacterium]|nr:hypothetical protein [Eubacteriales bacterium]
MSERTYWSKRPAAKAVYERRIEAENAVSFNILSNGIGVAAMLLGVFGICMGNLELVAAATITAVLAKVVE